MEDRYSSNMENVYQCEIDTIRNELAGLKYMENVHQCKIANLKGELEVTKNTNSHLQMENAKLYNTVQELKRKVELKDIIIRGFNSNRKYLNMSERLNNVNE